LIFKAFLMEQFAAQVNPPYSTRNCFNRCAGRNQAKGHVVHGQYQSLLFHLEASDAVTSTAPFSSNGPFIGCAGHDHCAEEGGAGFLP